ncbi:hypothetical protein PR202_ga18772 [Eleusine coracana subsp. coracana]|uniref:Uncharacterized protein n=1 Tax=Eleusine coracana subsp. coracana TaxID=191504 RepID=A0AAV5CTP6_ELECO|nr:hypothetical protein PR202_ga18772 [Eleusine coracana subsp. coracana]
MLRPAGEAAIDGGDGIRTQTGAPATADPWGSSFAGTAVREQPSPPRAGSFVESGNSARVVVAGRGRRGWFTDDEESLAVRCWLTPRAPPNILLFSCLPAFLANQATSPAFG